MRVITAGQLRARLGEALDQASAGERIVIERDHRQVAVLVPIEDAQQLDGRSNEARRRKLAAMARIRARALEMRREPEEPDGVNLDAEAAIRWERDHGHDDGA